MKTEEKAGHTQGPIKIGMQRIGWRNPWGESMEYETALYSTNQIKIAVVEQWIGEKGQQESEANADRFVASWNACEGIPTKALEKGVVGEMREALEAVLEIPYSDIRTETEIYGKVRAALAKLKGE